MKIVFTVVFVVCLSSLAAYAQASSESNQAQLTRMCVADMAKQTEGLEGLNVSKYCACLSERLFRHEEKLEHSDGGKLRKRIAKDLSLCMDKYLRPSLMASCAGFNDKLNAEKQKIRLDCGCYYKNLVNTFSDVWSRSLNNEPLSAEAQTSQMEAAAVSCSKETP